MAGPPADWIGLPPQPAAGALGGPHSAGRPFREPGRSEIANSRVAGTGVRIFSGPGMVWPAGAGRGRRVAPARLANLRASPARQGMPAAASWAADPVGCI